MLIGWLVGLFCFWSTPNNDLFSILKVPENQKPIAYISLIISISSEETVKC